MNLKRILAAAFAVALLFSLALPRLAVAAVSKADAAYIQSVAETKSGAGGVAEKKGKKGWCARTWTTTDGSGFYGKPEVKTSTENTDTTIVIRYTRYSTEYDLAFHSPIWGAYTIDETAVKNDVDGDRPASNPDFARPGQFFQEPMVIAASKELDIPAASHSTFTSTYDPRFPFVRAGGSVTEKQAKESKADRSIQRGHMVPNNAMKCQGTEEQGQTAQIESFSVANIVPQMAKSNAPTWSGLESACFDWAKETGQVWCIVGPVYYDRAHPTFIKKLSNGAEQVTPSPDALFYVVIGKRDGKTSAIAFLVPHKPEILDYRQFAVPVRKVEELTGINFMPDKGANDEVEKAFDQAWLHTPARKSASDENDN
ncbi:MAG: DNA/RNA non-specific endonuclease [Opitutae bacterium]|nr:DNA/RNA non-specific endonuclease [Opitutae bacterium]